MVLSKYVLVAATAFSMGAHACDCSLKKNQPRPECKKSVPAPVVPGSSVSGTQTQSQSVIDSQSQTAQGGAGGKSSSKSGSTSNSGASAVTGSSTSNSSSVTGPSTSSVGAVSSSSAGGSAQGGQSAITDNSSYTYREAANVVQPATMIINGCQVQGQAGGSNTRAAGMLGIGFTPKNCYDYIQAQAYLAIGAREAACEILNHTEAAMRAVKHGATLPSCVPNILVVPAPATGTYTREQVDTIVRKVASK